MRQSMDNHVRAQTKSSKSSRCEVTHVQKVARKATEEQKAAELKDKVQTVKKPLEEQQHRRNKRYSKRFNSTRPLKKPRATAAKEAVESKDREAADETNRDGSC